ncbi:MAG: DNA topoisomerase I, partial [Candidatus Aenigmarchaeota archaeon]|nr:DNA topoisomerase I [Candidatus Aenigmarchaeota archaeon]
MSYSLIIAEKPSAAKKIASALADKGISPQRKNSISYFKLTHNGEEIIVAPAVGHLFGVTTVESQKQWTYPVFDVEWMPTYKTSKNAAYAKKYLSNIVFLSKKAGNIVIACDYDIEGETIGYTILKYGCKKDKAKRMKFSTLTKKELVDSYENADPSVNMGLAMAGTTRHVLDFYFGINLSRALTLSLKAKGKYKVLSAGRVQGPALYFLAKREKEIQAFVPEPFWQIQADCEKEKALFKAMHKANKIFDGEKAKNIFEIVKGEKTAIVDDLREKEYKVNPPTPFNLSDLQMEAYKLFKITPKECQEHAQKLYEAALISYPRTSSQKLDPKLGFANILNNLAKNTGYTALANEVLKTKLQPNNGKKDDPAHPAIHPTGELMKPGLSQREEKIYDLIVKRFFSCFGQAAIRKSVDVTLDIKKELFAANGKTTLVENWFKWYA